MLACDDPTFFLCLISYTLPILTRYPGEGAAGCPEGGDYITNNDFMLCALTTALVSSRKLKFQSTDELPALPPTAITDKNPIPLFFWKRSQEDCVP